jgi:transposase-like protein
MQYVNIHLSVLTGEAFVGCEPTDRATWLCLMAYCCGQENGGVIECCGDWADRRWQQLAKVTKQEVERAAALWRWVDGDLVVNFYPEQAEKEVRSKRRGATIVNRRRWGKKRKSESLSDPLSEGEVANESDPLSVSTRKGKGREGNEKEGKATEIPDEKTVLQFGTEWGGDMARAIPAGIPEGWLLAWYAWRCSPSAGAFPGDWQADLTRRFRGAFLSGDRRARKNGEKTAGVSASVVAVAESQRKAAARAELRELTQELDALQLAGAEIPSEKTERERELRKELSE